MTGTRKPRIVLMVNKPNWALDFNAQSIAVRLRHRFDVRVRYASLQPDLRSDDPDLLFLFFWGERHYKRFQLPSSKIIKNVASQRWQYQDHYGNGSDRGFVDAYLDDCDIVTTTSVQLTHLLSRFRPDVYLCPSGFESSLWHPRSAREGRMRIGWVGNPNDAGKGLRDVLLPACEGRFDLTWTDGTWTRRQVATLYNNVDVLAISSVAEGEPLTLIEGMACGCFPVATRVGIVPELVTHGWNGLIVDGSVQAFTDALRWCEENLGTVRSQGTRNANGVVTHRSWDLLASRFADVFAYALARQNGAAPSPSRFAEHVGDSIAAGLVTRHPLYWPTRDWVHRHRIAVARRGHPSGHHVGRLARAGIRVLKGAVRRRE
jgi:hypothetical protein